jgi:16S rRNA (cytidine1402-2'-O)-methyltransferase
VTTGALYLIPVPLGEGDIDWTVPVRVRECAARLDQYVVEHPKAARRFLKQADAASLQGISMRILDEHTRPSELEALLEPLLAGHDIGLLSEAGCPAVADPGASLVRLAHQKSLRVVPLVGPSSILLALMASGLNGQRFTFHGYLPTDRGKRTATIIELEKASIAHDQTQIFIETPYRNQKVLDCLISTCRNDTVLCISASLTLEDEYIATKTVREWRRTLPDLNKKPVIFLLHG